MTSLLHWKTDSEGIGQRDLDEIYNRLFAADGSYEGGEESVIEMILSTAKSYLDAEPTLDGAFEKKIVLSIAIRVAAERFMAKKINEEEDFLDSLEANQSPKLLARFRREFPTESEAVEVIRSVLLMTPENIHLNSFMYEPIVDMSDDHLIKLMRRVMAL